MTRHKFSKINGSSRFFHCSLRPEYHDFDRYISKLITKIEKKQYKRLFLYCFLIGCFRLTKALVLLGVNKKVLHIPNIDANITSYLHQKTEET